MSTYNNDQSVGIRALADAEVDEVNGGAAGLIVLGVAAFGIGLAIGYGAFAGHVDNGVRRALQAQGLR